jgi:antitoxin (DNA-binding transcriptional repressor) of toxin-antitoxin stability system
LHDGETPRQGAACQHYAVRMSTVSVDQLQREGPDLVERAVRGEVVVITKGGHPVAELRALTPKGTPMADVLRAAATLPYVDPVKLRADIDDLLDTSL